MQLFREILKRIVYQRDDNGKIIEHRAAASSINLPSISAQPTREQMALLMGKLLKTSGAESVHQRLRSAICDIKTLYTETDDEFSQAKEISR